MVSATRGVRKTGSGAVVQSSPQKAYGDVRSFYNRFTDDTSSDKVLLNEVTGTRRTESDEVRSIPLDAIAVERRIEVV